MSLLPSSSALHCLMSHLHIILMVMAAVSKCAVLIQGTKISFSLTPRIAAALAQKRYLNHVLCLFSSHPPQQMVVEENMTRINSLI